MGEDEKKKKDYKILDSGERKKFGTGAQRDLSSGKGRFDLLPARTIRALAVHFEKGAEKYDARNWEKGIPVGRFLNSGFRHAYQFLDGEDDENHLIAAIWNFVCAYETILRTQNGMLPEELYNLPIKVKLPPVYDTDKSKKKAENSQ